jgi:L-lactate dehydrogenase (cytochrome)
MRLPPRWSIQFDASGQGISSRKPGCELTWADLKWIREVWSGPIIVKGILVGDDARRAVDEGAAAVVVSNHGGRQLDSAPASVRALQEIVRAVNGQVEIMMDGGIRCGSDVVKAICLGARAVLIGRAYAYGLVAAGRPGVAKALCDFESRPRTHSSAPWVSFG